MEKVFIVSSSRTPIGSFGGALSSLAPQALGSVTARETLRRAGSDVVVDEVIMGNVLGAGHGMNIARQVALGAGLPVTTPAFTINKVCGSGLKAVTLGALEIAAGEAASVLAGGTESMSQAGFINLQARWGAKLGHSELKDSILSDGLTDVFHSCHMGITAENLATRFGISREDQDSFALRSQEKVKQALEAKAFKEEIVPVTLSAKGKEIVVEDDEFPRPSTTIEALSKLKPAFKKDGTVTAGNASGINDGAASLLLMSGAEVARRGVKPVAEIVGWASAGVEPELMGTGPIEAVRKLVRKSSVSLSDIGVIESNEAFAAQAISVDRALGWDVAKVNVCGGAIALGHPIGASGARILVTLLSQMKRQSKELGLATACIGGGQGVAVLLRNCE